LSSTETRTPSYSRFAPFQSIEPRLRHGDLENGDSRTGGDVGADEETQKTRSRLLYATFTGCPFVACECMNAEQARRLFLG